MNTTRPIVAPTNVVPVSGKTIGMPAFRSSGCGSGVVSPCEWLCERLSAVPLREFPELVSPEFEALDSLDWLDSLELLWLVSEFEPLDSLDWESLDCESLDWSLDWESLDCSLDWESLDCSLDCESLDCSLDCESLDWSLDWESLDWSLEFPESESLSLANQRSGSVEIAL